jgi:type II secretory pathway component GspD/PulD (secretin)
MTINRMKTTTTLLLLLWALLPVAPTGVAGQEPPKPNRPGANAPAQPPNPREGGRSYTSLDAPMDAQSAFPAGFLKFTDADLDQVLAIYQELSNRTIVRAGNLPNVKITLTTQTRLTHREALQTLDTVLAASSIVMIPMGTQHMKAVPVAQASTEGAPVVELPPDQLPDSGTYITYFIKLKAFEPQEAVHVLQPFSKLPNSILAVGDTGVLVVRDYSANVRRMIQILGMLEAARTNARAVKPVEPR